MQPHFLSLHLLIAQLLFLLHPVSGLVTLQTIRNLTAVTDECKERIVESGGVTVDGMARVLGGVGGQVILGGGDEEEVEDVSSSFSFLMIDRGKVEGFNGGIESRCGFGSSPTAGFWKA